MLKKKWFILFPVCPLQQAKMFITVENTQRHNEQPAVIKKGAEAILFEYGDNTDIFSVCHHVSGHTNSSTPISSCRMIAGGRRAREKPSTLNLCRGASLLSFYGQGPTANKGGSKCSRKKEDILHQKERNSNFQNRKYRLHRPCGNCKRWDTVQSGCKTLEEHAEWGRWKVWSGVQDSSRRGCPHQDHSQEELMPCRCGTASKI